MSTLSPRGSKPAILPAAFSLCFNNKSKTLIDLKVPMTA
jgi:hypothetical protein